MQSPAGTTKGQMLRSVQLYLSSANALVNGKPQNVTLEDVAKNLQRECDVYNRNAVYFRVERLQQAVCVKAGEADFLKITIV